MELFRKTIGIVEQIINSLENSKSPFIYFILTFFFAVTLRNFLEIISTKELISLLSFTHYYIAYTALAMSLILLFYIATKTDVMKIARVILPSFLILNLAPLLDLLISQGKGYKMTYLLPGIHDNLVLRFFTFFGDFPAMGVTPGQRIEILLVLLACFIYFYTKNLNQFSGLFYTLLTYTLIFCATASPIIIGSVIEFNSLGLRSIKLLSQVFLLIILATGIVLIYLANRDYFKIFISDVRPWRLSHFELMFALGLSLGISNIHYNFDIIDIQIKARSKDCKPYDAARFAAMTINPRDNCSTLSS